MTLADLKDLPAVAGINELADWFATAKAGDTVIYHRGHLASAADTDAGLQLLAAKARNLAAKARNLASEGRAVLSQKRIGLAPEAGAIGEFAYLLTKRPRLMEGGFR